MGFSVLSTAPPFSTLLEGIIVNEPYIILDGEYIEPSKVNPKEHKFIGTFRPPMWNGATLNPGYSVICACGMSLYSGLAAHEHYLRGCFDVPQYVTIKRESPCKT